MPRTTARAIATASPRPSSAAATTRMTISVRASAYVFAASAADSPASLRLYCAQACSLASSASNSSCEAVRMPRAFGLSPASRAVKTPFDAAMYLVHAVVALFHCSPSRASDWNWP
jgi:hypothetical protein